MKRVFAVAAVLVSVSVLAQTEKAKQKIDFNEQEITSTQKKPLLDQHLGHKKPVFGNLIQVRMTFQPELEKSVEAVK